MDQQQSKSLKSQDPTREMSIICTHRSAVSHLYKCNWPARPLRHRKCKRKWKTVPQANITAQILACDSNLRSSLLTICSLIPKLPAKTRASTRGGRRGWAECQFHFRFPSRNVQWAVPLQANAGVFSPTKHRHALLLIDIDFWLFHMKWTNDMSPLDVRPSDVVLLRFHKID